MGKKEIKILLKWVADRFCWTQNVHSLIGSSLVEECSEILFILSHYQHSCFTLINSLFVSGLKRFCSDLHSLGPRVKSILTFKYVTRLPPFLRCQMCTNFIEETYWTAKIPFNRPFECSILLMLCAVWMKIGITNAMACKYLFRTTIYTCLPTWLYSYAFFISEYFLSTRSDNEWSIEALSKKGFCLHKNKLAIEGECT